MKFKAILLIAALSLCLSRGSQAAVTIAPRASLGFHDQVTIGDGQASEDEQSETMAKKKKKKKKKSRAS